MHKKLLTVLIVFSAIISGCNANHSSKLPSGIETINVDLKKVPLFIDRENRDIVAITLKMPDLDEPLTLGSVEVFFAQGSETSILSEASFDYVVKHEEETATEHFGTTSSIGKTAKITGNLQLGAGEHDFSISFSANSDALLENSIRIEKVRLSFGRRKSLDIPVEEDFSFRPGIVLRAAGQDNTDTYRIPGIITTSKGTLVAVYDNRYNNSKDLQEDIDIGMSRSTDGGITWEPMKVIMDMGEWGGRSERLNGIGDPAILYDPVNHTIWVAALWMSGSAPDQMLWWASQPGIEPHETGQFMLSKSVDDGLTWSEPINITQQIKDPKWSLLLQGPGAGITMRDGTLVFPAQFKEDIGTKALDGGQFTAHSTIIYSKDGGITWHIGTGARPNTTEAQVVELADGSLMLNMRDDQNRTDKEDNNGRAVSVTRDLGKTWEVHPSSNGALQEPNCMASLIATDFSDGNITQQVLFFSNPNNRKSRTNMTIKASLDGGLTWPENLQTELYGPTGYGYSCMTMVDEKTVGIVYEGVKELYFQKVPVSDILKQ